MRMRREGVRVALPIVLLLLAAGSASAGRADTPTLTGDVGLGGAFTISLHDANGVPIKERRSRHIHADRARPLRHPNFHLFGPGGVDVSTDIGNVENMTFTVTLVNGTYTYICDAHPSMKGTFTVGAVAAPPPTPTARTTFNGAVGPA
jgi:hypothetical protein